MAMEAVRTRLRGIAENNAVRARLIGLWENYGGPREAVWPTAGDGDGRNIPADLIAGLEVEICRRINPLGAVFGQNIIAVAKAPES